MIRAVPCGHITELLWLPGQLIGTAENVSQISRRKIIRHCCFVVVFESYDKKRSSSSLKQAFLGFDYPDSEANVSLNIASTFSELN